MYFARNVYVFGDDLGLFTLSVDFNSISIDDVLLIFVAFLSGVNAIATGALIDMHTMRYKVGDKAHT